MLSSVEEQLKNQVDPSLRSLDRIGIRPVDHDEGMLTTMITLPNVMLMTRDAGRVEMTAIAGNNIYGHGTDGLPVKFDVDLGAWTYNNVGWLSFNSDHRAGSDEFITNRDARVMLKLTTDGMYLINALIMGQVDASKLRQVLKVRGVILPNDIERMHAGGWRIKVDGSEWRRLDLMGLLRSLNLIAGE